MAARGIRGAITINIDTPPIITKATQTLLREIVRANPGLEPVDIASVLFTTTDDLVSMNPARAAREFGWTDVPLLGTQEAFIEGGLARCIRVLILWNTDLPQAEINHIYLDKAARLRPDLANNLSSREIK